MSYSLADAQRWYEATKKLVELIDRMGRRYWGPETEGMTLREVLYNDKLFRHVEAGEIQDLVQCVRHDLDDLAVMLMFSAFEATVRERTLDELNAELAAPPRHPILRKAVDEAREAVERGNFDRLVEAFKSLGADAKSQVDQVREFRNWVAHGRRGDSRENIDPQSARARLENFLVLIDEGPPGSSRSSPDD